MSEEERAVQYALYKIEGNILAYELYENAFKLIEGLGERHIKEACGYSKRLRGLIDRPLNLAAVEPEKLTDEEVRAFLKLRDNILLFESPYLFDSYCQYLEKKIYPVQNRLYLPRREVFKPVVDMFQRLADHELDEIFISMPPRTGKTTIATFFITWVMGRNPDMSNLYSSYSDTITTAFYNGVLQILRDPETYTWHEIFKKGGVNAVDTNAQTETINIDKRRKYATLTCRSIKGTLNGACDCSGFLVADDLLDGIEEANNPDRLKLKWQIITNNLLTRTKPSTGIVWIGTRWSLQDPIGVRLDMLQNEPQFSNVKYEVVNLAALDGEEKSNFVYAFDNDGVEEHKRGFDTDAFKRIRSGFERMQDMASWFAQYQGTPIEREGALFSPDNMRYFSVLPEGKPDRKFMAVDVAFGGGDYLSAPICYQYGDDIYVVDWIFDDSEKSITRPRIVRALETYDLDVAQFERNNGGGEYMDFIKEQLKDKPIATHLKASSAPTGRNKEMRIFDAADDIRLSMVFLEEGHRSVDYSKAMQNLYSFKKEGKNKHDDAPDSLAQAWNLARQSVKTKRPIIFKRPF